MSSSTTVLKDGCVTRDGFKSAHGRFTTLKTERVDGSRLRELFLPTLTPEANKLLYENSYFVQAQLQHYGVTYAPSEFKGRGTNVLKKALQAGKCDEVPAHIVKLQAEMHTEWLATCSPEDLARQPTWAMERYFTDLDGKPDRERTTYVVGFPLPGNSAYRVSQLCDAASAVSGLYQAKAQGELTRTVYLGWDKDEVQQAADGHAAGEKAKQQAAAIAREKRIAEQAAHAAKASGPPTLVGQYVLDCPQITERWNTRGELTMSINATKSRGLYQADFDFGVMKGIMMLSAEEDKLAWLLDEPFHSDSDGGGRSALFHEDGEDESDQPDADHGDDQNRTSAAAGTKRKAKGGRGSKTKVAKRGKTTKVKKTDQTKYYLVMRSEDTGTGQVYPEPTKGWMSFPANHATFTAVVDIPCLGHGFKITARKVGTVPNKPTCRWEDFCRAVYEARSRSRWR
ncbi:hypothetical protein CC85DRAFT_285098 [Cutaneotrichosporon oleaginosum]|uniref:Uncharacterized protein n=1 Tax=Cutaneotrichosporon oleaginosum TaxID=879819 RepID=A0A0J0XPB3_9TREE|nr:uncharacterized protein CC85DRAFT_285098 [Cutaneotrichosporon oleaginosum]KLT42940.1 hypothetical protein CC85DRAFT_285098 [Cutaneotrichosporon oleaginosum]TXT12642.1 hypothetical protein COLE_03052 [Cutaneotrichosporon oleaginosum]